MRTRYQSITFGKTGGRHLINNWSNLPSACFISFDKTFFKIANSTKLFSMSNANVYKHMTGDTPYQGPPHTHTHLRIHNQKKGVSENEAPGPVGAYTTTHNNTPTQTPARESIRLTATFDQVCSFCREETGL